MNRTELEYLKDIKADAKINEKVDKTGTFKIKILNRGEQLYYQSEDKALIFEIGLLPKIVLFTKTIKKWDNGKKVTDEERSILYERITQYFLNSDNEKIELCDD